MRFFHMLSLGYAYNNKGVTSVEQNENCYPRFGVGYRPRRCLGCAPRAEENQSCTEKAPCTSGNDPLLGMSLAMVYSPEQAFENLYEPDEGLSHGTIFTTLDMPFLGDGRKC